MTPQPAAWRPTARVGRHGVLFRLSPLLASGGARLTPGKTRGRPVITRNGPLTHGRKGTPVNHNTQYARSLTGAQITVLTLAALPMAFFGVLGGVGTYTNMVRAFGSTGTALGVVAGGEGATAGLALLTLGLTLFAQTVPFVVRAGLWALPVVASTVGVLTASSGKLAAAQAMTPLAMCVSSEALALLARRTVVYRTGADADMVRQLAYLRAKATTHPNERARERAERKAWKVAASVGAGDIALGVELLEVQRAQLTGAAKDALASMFSLSETAALAAGESSESPAASARVDGDAVGESAGQVGERSESLSDDDEPVPPGSQIAYAVTLLADTPPAWDGLNLREAVARADSLAPGLTAPMLSAALREVGIDASPASIRSTRSALRRSSKAEA